MRKRAKVDANQTSIVNALRQVGASVQSIATIGNGVPDLLVGFRGSNLLMEVKVGKSKLTTDETEWHQEWSGQVAIVRSADEALQAIGAI